MAKLYFYGGAQSVTGSNYLLDTGTIKILIDCGLFQGSQFSEEYNYRPFPYNPAEIDYLFVTHSHADHIGRIPKLYKDGFRGTIYTSEPTQGIIEVALPDTLDKILQEAKGMGHEALYSKDDLTSAVALIRGVPYQKQLKLGDQVTATLHNASHILGSSMIEIVITEDGQEKRLLFSGDLGNPPTILLDPIDYVENVDYMVIESAYGNRIHENHEERKEKLLQTIIETVDRGGVLMVPSFAIERTQELLLEIDSLFEQHRLPRVPIFVDSPLAGSITKVYGKFSRYFNPAAVALLKDNKGLFEFPWLQFTPTVNESKAINDVQGSKVIIAGSGMSQGGRILHHESRYLSDERNTILFVGYQVAGSLGRRILEGASQVKIFGQNIPVRARVTSIESYSAHADQNGLVQCVEHAQKGNRLKKVFVVQGEYESSFALAKRITKDLGIEALVPGPDDAVEL